MNTHQSSTLLHRFIFADAVISGATGLAMLLGAGVLSDLLGVPAPLMRFAGVILLPFAAVVFYWSSPDRLSRPKVWTVIALNLAWVAGSVALLVAGWIEPNTLGMAFIIFQAVVVALFAELQYTGLRSLSGSAVRG
jgi:hypothetical protein